MKVSQPLSTYEVWSNNVVHDFNADFEMPPPLPSPTFANAHSGSSRFMRDRTTPTDPHHPSLSQRPAFNRANSATPSIVVQHHDMGTPESVKIRRMKFEIEIESPGKRRARSASTSVGDSPSKLGASGASRRKHIHPNPARTTMTDRQDTYRPPPHLAAAEDHQSLEVAEVTVTAKVKLHQHRALESTFPRRIPSTHIPYPSLST